MVRWGFVLALIGLAALPQQTPDELLLVNGKIWTVNPAQPEAEALLIRGNRITAVGTTADLTRLQQPSTTVVDLHGKLVLPGFNDAHVHFYSGGANLAGVQLRLSKSEAEFRDTLKEFAAHQLKGQWITGGKWDHENWAGAKLPTRQLIDPVTPSQPVFVSRLDGHMALANSAALKLAGVDRNTKDVPGGVIERDASGEPTGILKDAAMGLVTRVIPGPTEEQIITAIRAGQTYAAANGVTSVQDMSVSPEVLRAYQAMLERGQLRVLDLGSSAIAEVAEARCCWRAGALWKRLSPDWWTEGLCRWITRVYYSASIRALPGRAEHGRDRE